MQTLYPAPDQNPSGADPTRILSALRGASGARRLSFRYELLTSAMATVTRNLDGVESCQIEQNWLADIKRTATLRVRDGQSVDYLSDRIRPWVRLALPPYGPLDWVEWPQGVFLLTSPRRSASAAGVVSREVKAFDLLQLYADDTVSTRYVVAVGASYVNTVTNLLGIGQPKIVTPSTATLPAAREWDPGTSKLRIMNDLLGAINYESLSFDEWGTAMCRPYLTPAQRAEEYTYADDAVSGLIAPDAEQELDLWSVPNRWTLVVSEPDRPPLTSTYTNADPSSPTSTVRRGRVIAEPARTEQNVADQATLDAKVARLAFEASQLFESVDFSTALVPIHSGNDVLRLRYSPLAINARYVEHSWSMDLRPGALMRHKARRTVAV